MDSEGGKIAQVHKKYGNTMYITVSLPFRFSESFGMSVFLFFLLSSYRRQNHLSIQHNLKNGLISSSLILSF